MSAATYPSHEKATRIADTRRRRQLSRYEEASGTYTKVRSICAWDFDASGRLRVFKSEKELLEHETSCGDRRKLGEHPPGGYSRLATDQQTLAQHIDQSNQIEHEDTRDVVREEATKRKSALFVVPRQFIYAIESVRICVLLPGGFLLR